MGVLSRLARLWRTLFRKESLDRELDEEIQAAIDTLTDRYRGEGLDAQDARRAALDALGGPSGLLNVKEDVREGRLGAALDTLLLDVRTAWRALRRTPLLTSTIAGTLALGVGANTAIFSVVHAVLLEPLPYRDADRLAFIWLNAAPAPMSGPDFQDIRNGATTFEALGGIWASGTVALSGGDGDPEQLRTSLVTANFFDVLGAGAALGRTFRDEDVSEGANRTILLGWDLFSRRFGEDPSLIGRAIVVDDEPAEVIGVMPKDFRLLLPPDSAVPDHLQVWQPLWPGFEHGPRGNQFLRVVGRMRPGVTIEQTRADVDAVARRIGERLRIPYGFATAGLQTDGVREVRVPLLALFGGVGILLAIACVNVGGLLVARAASRSRETAVRHALGARRGRLVRQSAIEGLFLALAGAGAGVVTGTAALRLLIAMAPDSLDRISLARIDLTVLLYTAAVSLAWGLLFSLAPVAEVLRTSRRTGTILSSGTARATSGAVRQRTRGALLAVQVALSLVLLVSAGLLMRAFVRIQSIDPGFRADRHLTFRVALPGSRYPEGEALARADREIRRRLAALPGVTGAGAISHLPYDDLPNWALTYAPTLPGPDAGAFPRANTRAVTPGAFEAIGVELLEGRLFADDEPRPGVIVDDLLAGRLWPGRSALGERVFVGQATPEHSPTVIGVVRHLRLRSLVEDLTPQIFIPYQQWQRSPMAYVVRTDGDPLVLVPQVRAAIAAFDSRLPIYDMRPLSDYVARASSIQRFTMLLAAAFASTALVLTCIGIYGVAAYGAASRRWEFGVRRALGASGTDVVRAAMSEGLRFALTGCAAGLAVAGSVVGLLREQLHDIDSYDPVAFGASLALMVVASGLACLIPARRAIAVTPMEALRAE